MRRIAHVSYETVLEVGDRVRYVDWPEKVNRIGRKYQGAMRTREGRVIELHDAMYTPSDINPEMSWLSEREKAVVEFDDGTVDTIEGWRFPLSLNDGREKIRQLELVDATR
jgi:hypothetical protein